MHVLIHTQHLHTPHWHAVFGALDVVNVASDNYRVTSACNQNGMSQWNLTCTPNSIVAGWVVRSGSNCALFLDNAQLPYLEVYNALFVL